MKSNAIQNERDAIGKRKKIAVVEKEDFIAKLIAAEAHCTHLRDTVIMNTSSLDTYDCGKVKINYEDEKTANLNDIGKSIHQQLLLFIEWAKLLKEFQLLSHDDQMALLKGGAASNIVLGVAYRSVIQNAGDSICLANETKLGKEQAEQVGDINCVVGRIIDEVVTPMRRLRFDLCEYVALKAILFYNPVARDLNDTSTVEDHRYSVLRSIQKRCTEKALENMEDEQLECRNGKLLLLLPAIQAIAQQLVEDVQLARLFGLVNVDSLMEELILNDRKVTDNPILQQNLSSPVNTSVKAEVEVEE